MLSARRASTFVQGEPGLFSLNTPASTVFAGLVCTLPLSEWNAFASSGVRSKTTSMRPSPAATERMPSALPIALS